MTKKRDNESDNQKKGRTIKLDDVHWRIIRGLQPFYGNSEPEVVRNIVLMWLNENIGSEAIRKLEELGAIQFND